MTKAVKRNRTKKILTQQQILDKKAKRNQKRNDNQQKRRGGKARPIRTELQKYKILKEQKKNASSTYYSKNPEKWIKKDKSLPKLIPHTAHIDAMTQLNPAEIETMPQPNHNIPKGTKAAKKSLNVQNITKINNNDNDPNGGKSIQKNQEDVIPIQKKQNNSNGGKSIQKNQEDVIPIQKKQNNSNGGKSIQKNQEDVIPIQKKQNNSNGGKSIQKNQEDVIPIQKKQNNSNGGKSIQKNQEDDDTIPYHNHSNTLSNTHTHMMMMFLPNNTDSLTKLPLIPINSLVLCSKEWFEFLFLQSLDWKSKKIVLQDFIHNIKDSNLYYFKDLDHLFIKLLQNLLNQTNIFIIKLALISIQWLSKGLLQNFFPVASMIKSHIFNKLKTINANLSYETGKTLKILIQSSSISLQDIKFQLLDGLQDKSLWSKKRILQFLLQVKLKINTVVITFIVKKILELMSDGIQQIRKKSMSLLMYWKNTYGLKIFGKHLSSIDPQKLEILKSDQPFQILIHEAALEHESDALLLKIGGPTNIIKISIAQRISFTNSFQNSSAKFKQTLSLFLDEGKEDLRKLEIYIKIIYSISLKYLVGQIISEANIYYLFNQFAIFIENIIKQKVLFEKKLTEITRLTIYMLADLETTQKTLIKNQTNKVLLLLLNFPNSRHLLQILFLMLQYFMSIKLSKRAIELLLQCINKIVRSNNFFLELQSNINFILFQFNFLPVGDCHDMTLVRSIFEVLLTYPLFQEICEYYFKQNRYSNILNILKEIKNNQNQNTLRRSKFRQLEIEPLIRQSKSVKGQFPALCKKCGTYKKCECNVIKPKSLLIISESLQKSKPFVVDLKTDPLNNGLDLLDAKNMSKTRNTNEK